RAPVGRSKVLSPHASRVGFGVQPQLGLQVPYSSSLWGRAESSSHRFIKCFDHRTAARATFEGRKGHFVGRDMKVGRPHPTDYRAPTYLLAGILRCGRRLPDGTLCHTPLRSHRQKDAAHHAYTCLSRSEGGCGGVSRRGDLVDMFVSEAVLAKL